MNDDTTRKPRTTKPKIYRVEDGAGRGGFYYATSTTQAKAMHTENLTSRLATDIEIMEIGRRGLGVVNLTPAGDDDGGQVDAFADTGTATHED